MMIRLRTDPRFQAILAEAEVGQQQALDAFREAGGERPFQNRYDTAEYT